MAAERSRARIMKDLPGHYEELGSYRGATGNHGMFLSRNMALRFAFQKHDVF